MAGLAFLAIAYVLSQFYRSFMAVMTPALTGELGATNGDLALATGFWFFTFAMMQFAVGVSLDRFGPRRTSSLLLGVAGGAGVFLFATASAPWMIIVAMGLIGIGCSAVLMAAFFLFARQFSPARFAFLASAFIGFGNLGNIVGASPMANAVEAFGWRPVVAAIGVFTVLVALALFFLIRDPDRETETGNSGLRGYLDLIKIRYLWPIIPMSIFAYAAPAGIRGLWTGPFLAEVHGADAITIGNVTFWMALAMAAGSFIYSPLDQLFNSRKWVVAGGTLISAITICALAVYPDMPVAAITGTLVILGVAGMAYGIIMAHARAFFPAHLTGRGVTLINFFSIGGVALMQVLTGALVSAIETPDAPSATYSGLFGFYAATLLVALALYMFSRDAKPKG